MCISENITGECNCGPIEGLFFDIKDLELTQFKKTGENSMAPLAGNETVAFENYSGISVFFEADYLSQHQHKAPIFSLTPSAYACSCSSNGENGSKFEEFRSVTITTLNDFDEMHLANSNINDLILVDVFNQELKYIDQYLEDNPGVIKYQGLALKLDRKPILNEHFIVKVRLELSNGEVYENISSSVNLQ